MRLRIIAFALVLSISGASAALAATPAAPAKLPKACQTVAEENAERVRQLQTELMIAALKCRTSKDANLTEAYNGFIRKHSNALLTQSNVLQAYFKRQYGSGYLKRFDSYITQLANEVSRRSQTVPQYCQSIRPLLASVTEVEPAKLALFDGKLAPVQAVARSPQCKVTTDMKSASATPAPAPVKTAAATPAKPTKPAKPAKAPKPATPAKAQPATPAKAQPASTPAKAQPTAANEVKPGPSTN